MLRSRGALCTLRRQTPFHSSSIDSKPHRSILPPLSSSSLAAMTSAWSYPVHLPELAFLTISPSFFVASSSSFLTVEILGVGTSSSSWLLLRLLDVGGASESRGMSLDVTSLRP